MVASTITICNKLQRKDSVTGLDVWFVKKLHNIEYSKKTVSSVTGTTVSIGESFVVLLPFDDEYKPYEEWKNNTSDGYTISAGDFIFLGDISDEITPNTIMRVKNQYEPNVVEVRSVLEVRKTLDTNYRLKIEGV